LWHWGKCLKPSFLVVRKGIIYCALSPFSSLPLPLSSPHFTFSLFPLPFSCFSLLPFVPLSPSSSLPFPLYHFPFCNRGVDWPDKYQSTELNTLTRYQTLVSGNYALWFINTKHHISLPGLVHIPTPFACFKCFTHFLLGPCAVLFM